MHVKTFEGFSVSDAMKKVKKEFGSDAVILQTYEKKIEDGKIKLVEIKAAAPYSYGVEQKSSYPFYDQNQNFDKIYFKLDKIEHTSDKIVEKILSEKSTDQIIDHLREIKVLISNTQKFQGSQKISIDPDMDEIYQNLLINGLFENYLTEIIDFMKMSYEKERDESKKFTSMKDYYKSCVIKWLIKKINIYPKLTFSPGKNLLHCFVGPTGAGKTSVIAKMAAYYKKQKAKVCFVSFNPIKIGASDELRLYSKILDLKYYSIESALDLNNVILEQRDTSIFLIDTCGINPRCKKELEIFSGFKDAQLPIENHLVLSSTEKSINLDRSIAHFGYLNLSSLIFTKLDASMVFGDILNMSLKWSLPLSYFSTGPKSPEDFERATKERVIEKICGL